MMRFFIVLLSATLVPMIAHASVTEHQGHVALEESLNKKITVAQNNRKDSSRDEDERRRTESEYIQYKIKSKPVLGVGVGVGLNPYPTTRLELGWHSRWDSGFLSLAYEASWFSKQHMLARALLLDTYERDLNYRRLLLNWRGTGSVYAISSIGYENQSVQLFKPVSDESKELKRIINGSRQGYLFGLGLGSTMSYDTVRINMEWLGFTLLKELRSPTFTDRGTNVSDEQAEKSKNEFKDESRFGIRFLNFSLFFDL